MQNRSAIGAELYKWGNYYTYDLSCCKNCYLHLSKSLTQSVKAPVDNCGCNTFNHSHFAKIRFRVAVYAKVRLDGSDPIAWKLTNSSRLRLFDQFKSFDDNGHPSEKN
jgi:hypothetical protein